MEKRIELERGRRAVDEIKELNLDNCRATQVSGLTNEYVQLESLSLINVGLTTLKGFPSLPNLKKLELSDNRISNGLHLLQGCPKLISINLSGNKIKDLETLEPLKSLSELRTLDLFNCEVTNIEDYREKVFSTLTSLKYLDGFDRNNEEDEDGGESDDEDYDDEKDYGEPGDDDDDDDEEGGDDDDDVDDSDLLNDTGAAHQLEDDDDDDDDDDDLDDDDLDDDDLDDEDDEGEFNETGELNGGGHDDDEDDDVDEDENDEGENGVQQHGVKRKHDDDDDDDEEED